MNMRGEHNANKSRRDKSENSLAKGIAIRIAVGAGIGVAIHTLLLA
jgi:hypothetical protein